MKDESYNMQLVQHITNTVYKLEICMSPSQYESFFKGEDEDAGSESDFGSIATETTLEETSAAPTDVEVGEDELLINSLSDQE